MQANLASMRARSAQRAQKFSAKPASIAAPLGGWNARDALGAMDPLDAVTLQNWWPGTSSVILRFGQTLDHEGVVPSHAVYSFLQVGDLPVPFRNPRIGPRKVFHVCRHDLGPCGLQRQPRRDGFNGLKPPGGRRELPRHSHRGEVGQPLNYGCSPGRCGWCGLQ